MSQTDARDPMPGKELANMAACYEKASMAYAPREGEELRNKMTNLAGKWIEIETECQLLSESATFQVSFQTETGGMPWMSQEAQNPAVASGTWPPFHFSEAEKQMITNPMILQLVEGRCPEMPGSLLQPPTKNSMPSAVRVFLTSLALENYRGLQP